MIDNKEEIFKRKELRAGARVRTREKVLIYTVAKSRKPLKRRELGDKCNKERIAQPKVKKTIKNCKGLITLQRLFRTIPPA